MRRSLPPLLLLLLPIGGCGAREPSEPLGWRLDDGRTLLAAGIRADGTIEDGGPRPGDTPVELAFRRGRPVYHALRVTGASPLLDRLALTALDSQPAEADLKIFNGFDSPCTGECPVGADDGECCAIAPPIVVIVDG